MIHVKARSAAILSATLTCAGSSLAGQVVAFVDDDALPGGDGTTWTTAYNDLQDALDDAAQPGSTIDQVWIAAGTYAPGEVGEETETFALMNGVSLFGGFAGFEDDVALRDIETNQTILTGDLGHDDVYGVGEFWYIGWLTNTANSAHVVTAGMTDSTAVIDGFTIMAGNTGASGTPAGSSDMVGGGIYIVGGSPTIRNCTFSHHLAAFASGAAIYIFDGSPTITDCTFQQNYVHLGQGAGIQIWGASAPTIDDCTFKWNRCVGSLSGEAYGGGIVQDARQTLTAMAWSVRPILRCSSVRGDRVLSRKRDTRAAAYFHTSRNADCVLQCGIPHSIISYQQRFASIC